MNDIVLDASAVLALLRDEPGASRVEDVIGQGLIGSVNLAEVLTVLIRKGASAKSAEEAVDSLRLTVAPFDEQQARWAGTMAGRLKISLGDRACLALAASRGATVLTADRPWADLDLGVEIDLIR